MAGQVLQTQPSSLQPDRTAASQCCTGGDAQGVHAGLLHQLADLLELVSFGILHEAQAQHTHRSRACTGLHQQVIVKRRSCKVVLTCIPHPPNLKEQLAGCTAQPAAYSAVHPCVSHLHELEQRHLTRDQEGA